MARRKDLAGLAALGALGMILSDRQKQSQSTGESEAEYRSDPYGAMTQDERDARRDINGRTLAEENYGNEGRRQGPVGIGRVQPSSGGRTPSKPSSSATPNGGPRRGPAFETGSAGQKGPRFGEEEAYLRSLGVTGNPGGSYDAPTPQRRLSSAEAMAQLDKQLGYREGPTAGDGRSVDSTELGRNISNTLNATAGLSVPGYVGKMTQRQYNAQAAARRAAEGFSPAEAQAAREAAELAARDAKVLNPNAWLAGPQGMKNFKKGGQVKKMASGGAVKVSASSRGDGIAQRGKTRGKMR